MLVNTPQVDDWTWIDAIQMGMPVLAQLGRLTGEQKYYDKMWQMYSCSRNEIGNGLFNQKRDCGGETLISFLLIKNLTERIAFGAGETDGYMPHW